MWTELLAKQVSLKELQAYIVLRVAKLIPDDKKRVIVKSKDAIQSGLTTTSTSRLFDYISKGKNTNANATTLFRQIKRKTNMFFFRKYVNMTCSKTIRVGQVFQQRQGCNMGMQCHHLISEAGQTDIAVHSTVSFASIFTRRI